MDTVKEAGLITLVLFGILVLPVWAVVVLLVIEVALFVSFNVGN